HALVPPADIERIGEPLLIVGADVEQDRQRCPRMNAGARRVERELADRNTHAAGALIAEPENALAVADHDDARPVERRVGENLADAMLVRIAQEQAARPAEDFAEALAAF